MLYHKVIYNNVVNKNKLLKRSECMASLIYENFKTKMCSSKLCFKFTQQNSRYSLKRSKRTTTIAPSLQLKKWGLASRCFYVFTMCDKNGNSILT